MSKYLYLTAFALLPMLTWAQTPTANTPTLPKLRYYSRFLSEKWELGDKDVQPKDVALHLEKHSPAAYYDWRRGQSLSKTGDAFTSLGTVSGVVGCVALFTVKDDYQRAWTSAGGFIGLAVFDLTGLCFNMGGHTKMERAMDTYNRAAGY